MTQTVMELKIAPVRDGLRDLRRNIRWILGIAVIWVLYTLASSAVIGILEDWSYWHSCYFTLINMTTVGFGDIYPITHEGKIVAGVNSVFGLILFGLFVASITMALQPSSFDGTAELKDKSSLGNEDVETENSDVDKFNRFLKGVNDLVSTGKRAEEVVGEFPRIVDMTVDLEGDTGRSKFVHIRIRVRNG
ncbi:potassium channel family protein [Pseudoalteromonas sp. B193]